MSSVAFADTACVSYLGAAVSRSISNFSYPLLLAVYLRYSGLLHSFWAGWELSKAWKGVRHFLVLGAPGCLMMCFEFWAFEVLAILAGILPNSVVAIGANTVSARSSVGPLFVKLVIDGRLSSTSPRSCT